MMEFIITKNMRRVTPKVVPGLVEEFRRTHNETHEYILNEALKTHDVYLPFFNTNRTLLLVNRHNDKGVLVNGTVFGGSVNAMAKQLSANKLTSQQMAAQCDIPVLATEVLEDEKAARAFWRQHQGNCILKPLDGRMGKDVFLEFASEDDYVSVFKRLTEHATVIGQARVNSPYDLRVLCIGGKFAAAAVRKAFFIVGDGVHTVRQLVDAESVARQQLMRNAPESAPIKSVTLESLEIDIDGESILPKGERLQLTTSNVAQGGTIIEISDAVHPWFIEKAERLAQFFGFDVISIDFITDSYLADTSETPKAYFMETNARPNLVLHHRPHEGAVRNVARMYLDYVQSSPKTLTYTIRSEV